MRAVIDTWTDRCPMAGRCTECGLEFQWCEVLNTALLPPRWCVEYSDRWWEPVTRTARTFTKTFAPWRFWSSLKMTHEIRWPLLIAYLACMAVVIYVIFCVSHGLMAATVARLYLPNDGVGSAFDWLAFGHATAFPFSSETMTIGISPRRLIQQGWMWMISPAAFMLAGHWLCAAGFAALPASRRQAKVRWAHIIRITLYGHAMFAAVLALGMLYQGLLFLELPTLVQILLFVAQGLVFALLPGEIMWWSFATGRYLKMPHPWGVGFAVVVMALLATMLAAVLIWLATQP